MTDGPMRDASGVAPMDDAAFARAQRIADAKARRELLKKMRERPLEQIIDEFERKVEHDPDAPFGRCEKCKEAYKTTESGRLKDHTCSKYLLPHTTSAAPAIADRAVEAVRGIRRVRRDTED